MVRVALEHHASSLSPARLAATRPTVPTQTWINEWVANRKVISKMKFRSASVSRRTNVSLLPAKQIEKNNHANCPNNTPSSYLFLCPTHTIIEFGDYSVLISCAHCQYEAELTKTTPKIWEMLHGWPTLVLSDLFTTDLVLLKLSMNSHDSSAHMPEFRISNGSSRS